MPHRFCKRARTIWMWPLEVRCRHDCGGITGRLRALHANSKRTNGHGIIPNLDGTSWEPFLSYEGSKSRRNNVLGEISCRRLTHYQPHDLIIFISFFVKYPIRNIKHMSKNIPDIKKTCFEHFWDQKWAPAQAARTARTPRPIFDDKRCSNNVSKMFF